MTDAVQEMQSKSDGEGKVMSENAKAYYEAHFAMERLVTQLEDMMEKAISEP